MLMRSLEGVAIWSQIKIRFVSGLESCPHNRIQFVSLFHGLKLALERIENFFNMHAGGVMCASVNPLFVTAEMQA